MRKIPSLFRGALSVISIAGAGICALGACGKGADLGSGSVQVVQVAPNDSSCFACNYVTDVALGSSGIYAAAVKTSQGNQQSAGPTLAAIDFSTSSAPNASWPNGAQGIAVNGVGFDIAASGDGTLSWALVPSLGVQTDAGGGSSSPIYVPDVFTTTESTFASASPSGIFLPQISSNGNGVSIPHDVVGLVADADATYVAYARQANSNGGPVPPNPDAPGFPASNSGGSSGGDAWNGAVARVARADASIQVVQGFTFVPSFALHVLAASKDTLYWPDYGAAPSTGSLTASISIDVASKASFGAAPTSFVAIENAGGTPYKALVGIAANDRGVAWTASQTSSGNVTEPGCQIGFRTTAGTVTKLYDSFASGTTPEISCFGVALDDEYAYVAVVSEVSGQNNGMTGNELVGTGIARVPLAGGSLQVTPLESNHWYGPRRVLVDATYVYAIDPSFVLRFPKTDLSN